MRGNSSYDDLEAEIFENSVSRAAAVENTLRHKIAIVVRKAMLEKRIPRFYYFRELGISQSQTDRLMQDEHGGTLSLYSICRAADAMGLDISIRIKPKRKKKKGI